MSVRVSITLVVVWVGSLCFCQSLLAQQPNAPRKIVVNVSPLYPDLARPMRLEGTVKLSVIVAPNGSVKSTEALGGNPLLLKAAQDAISKWKWTPSTQETVEHIELKFRLD